MFSPPSVFLLRIPSRWIIRLSAAGLTCLLVLTAGTRTSAQTSAQQIDRTQTFLRVNEVKKMTFQYHKEKPRQPAKEFAKFKHKDGLYDEATWQRKARWRRKLRMRRTCTGRLREVEKIHSIRGEGTVVTVIRGKNIEKYWVAPFRSKMLNGLGVGDSEAQVIVKLGRPYRQTGSVWAYACLADSAESRGSGEQYGECLRVYFKGSAVIAAKYFGLQDCRAAQHDAFFAMMDNLKKMNDAFDRAALAKKKRFRKYPTLAFRVEFKDDQPIARRKSGEKLMCIDPEPVVDALYTIGGGKAAVVITGVYKDEVYWVGRFRSNKLNGVAAGDTRRTVIRKMGLPLQRNRSALAFACKDGEAAKENQTVYYACLKIFFKKGKTIGAYFIHKSGC